MTDSLNLPHEDAKHIACKLLGHKLRAFKTLGIEACPECEPVEYMAYKRKMYLEAYLTGDWIGDAY